MTQAISVNPAVIGSASGLYGFSQMGVGAICTALVGMGSNPALTAAIILVSGRRDRPDGVLAGSALSRADELTGYCRQSIPLPSIWRNAAFQ
jgi:hypothetical protein